MTIHQPKNTSNIENIKIPKSSTGIFEDVKKKEQYQKIISNVSKEEKEVIEKIISNFSNKLEEALINKMKNILKSEQKEEIVKKIKEKIK